MVADENTAVSPQAAPAPAWQRPPFEVGNTVSMRHGAWSPRRVDPLAREMVAAVEGDAGITWLRPVDRPAVWAWARCEARVQLLAEWLADRGDLTDDGEVRPAADLLTRLEGQAAGLRGRLGLDPLSRARLGRDTVATQVDLARLWASETADSTATALAAGAGPHGPAEGPENGDDDDA